MHVLLHSLSPTLQQAPINPHLRWRLLDTSGQIWVSLSRVTAPFSWVLVHTRFCLCPPRVYLPVLCIVLWQLYGGVNGDLLHEDLCHTQVCCTQSPCPCRSPLLTRTSTGDAQAQFCLSLCGVSGSWCAQGLFKPSECLCRKWGLILNGNLPLLPPFWGFSFVPGHGVSPHSHRPSAYHLAGVSLTLDVGYLLTAASEKCSCCSWPGMWGISLWPLHQSTATALDCGGTGVFPHGCSSTMKPPLQFT